MEKLFSSIFLFLLFLFNTGAFALEVSLQCKPMDLDIDSKLQPKTYFGCNEFIAVFNPSKKHESQNKAKVFCESNNVVAEGRYKASLRDEKTFEAELRTLNENRPKYEFVNISIGKTFHQFFGPSKITGYEGIQLNCNHSDGDNPFQTVSDAQPIIEDYQDQRISYEDRRRSILPNPKNGPIPIEQWPSSILNCTSSESSEWPGKKPSYLTYDHSLKPSDHFSCSTFQIEKKASEIEKVYLRCGNKSLEGIWRIRHLKEKGAFKITGYASEDFNGQIEINIAKNGSVLRYKSNFSGLNCTTTSGQTAYANLQSLDEWKELYDDNAPVAVFETNQTAAITENETTKRTISSDTCNKLNMKIQKHIQKEEYGKASEAKQLLSEFNCSNMISSKQTSSPSSRNVNKPMQLSCNVGPLGKTIFGQYGNYRAKAYEDNPPKDCLTTYQYCKSRSKSISDGARIKPSERSNTPTSYTAHCNSRSSGLGFNTNCNVYGNNNSGGFAGGLADGLAKGIEVAAAKKQIYVSNFEICMADMGYSLTEK